MAACAALPALEAKQGVVKEHLATPAQRRPRRGAQRNHVDTVFLFDSGDPRGGRYMAPQPVVNAFNRYNRFRRFIVHAIRICNEKEASEILMKGIAEASGGTYVWMKKPPEESKQ